MRHRHFVVAPIVVLIGLFAVAACDGDDETTATDADDSATTEVTDDESSAESVSVFDLDEGMCVKTIEQDSTVEEVDVVDCDESHAAEVFGVFDLEGDDEFPGSDEVDGSASSGCEQRFVDYVGASFQDSRFQATYLAPTEETWARGDREVVCVAYSDDGDLTESIEGTNE